jgi:hypothetical protein
MVEKIINRHIKTTEKHNLAFEKQKCYLSRQNLLYFYIIMRYAG